MSLSVLSCSVPLDDKTGYCIEPSASDGAFFDGRCADILIRGAKVGVMGMLHPEALAAFDIPFPCSAMEIRIDVPTGVQG
jgi:phenylalanyl-tRNA synthetase beta chain